VKTTLTTQRVLRVRLDPPSNDDHRLEIMRASGLKSGGLYPILGRLEKPGWIEGDLGRRRRSDRAPTSMPALPANTRRRCWRPGLVAETARQLGLGLVRT